MEKGRSAARILRILLFSLLLLYALAACSNADDVSDNRRDASSADSDASNNGIIEEENSEELTADLSIYTDIGLSDDWFQKFVIDPVQEQFPHVTMKLYRKQSGTSPEDLIAAGQFPDILYNSTPRMSSYKRLGLVYDMTSLIEKYGRPDLDRNDRAFRKIDENRKWDRLPRIRHP